MRRIDYIEFYITNVCNLTCEGCNRFNNIKFRGWQAWKDYQDLYREWAQRIDLTSIAIMGGEPLLNPTLIDWIEGLHELWPRSTIQILTNGTRLGSIKNLAKVCRKTGSWIGISKHRNDDLFELEKRIEQHLELIVDKKYDPSGQVTSYGGNYVYTGTYSDQVIVWDRYKFSQNALLTKPDGKYTLHNSDVDLAHQNCTFAQCKCYHFVHGKFYKCGPVALFPELDEQFVLDISNEDRQLINSYRPLTIDNYDQYHEEFFQKLDQPIAQCKFCPEYYKWKKIFPVTKNVKL